MMVAALTPNIRKSGMVAFIRTFAQQAHQQWLEKKKPKKTNLSSAEQTNAIREYGIAFLLYTGQIKQWKRAEESKLKLLDDSYKENADDEWKTPFHFLTYGKKAVSDSHVLALIYKPILPTSGPGTQRTPGNSKSATTVTQVGPGDSPYVTAFLADNAQTAIDVARCKHSVGRVCILGHQMFEVRMDRSNKPPPRWPRVAIRCGRRD